LQPDAIRNGVGVPGCIGSRPPGYVEWLRASILEDEVLVVEVLVVVGCGVSVDLDEFE
jgi:hypothetical protein